jgi:N-acetylneuraminic acid mutarotase
MYRAFLHSKTPFPMALILAACGSDGAVDPPPPVGCPPECPAPLEGSWGWAKPLPQSRREMPAALVDGKIYVAGGFTPEREVLASVVVYDPGADTWSTIPNMPGRRHHPGVAGLGGKLYVIGGYSDLGAQPWPAHANLWEYDPATDEWSSRAPAPRAIAAMGVAAFEGRLYVFGGADGVDYFDSTFIYDPQTDSWSNGTAMHAPVEHTAATVLASNIYVAAGRALNGGNSRALRVYTPETDSWRLGPSMELARSGHGLATMGARLYVFGGERLGGTNQLFTSVEEYDPESESWREMNPLPLVKTGMGAVGYEDRIHILGGEGGRGDDHLVFRVP